MSERLIPDPQSLIKTYRTAASLDAAQVTYFTGAPWNLTAGSYTTVAGDSIDGVIDAAGGTVLTDVLLCDDGSPACFMAAKNGMTVCEPKLNSIYDRSVLTPTTLADAATATQSITLVNPHTEAVEVDVFWSYHNGVTQSGTYTGIQPSLIYGQILVDGVQDDDLTSSFFGGNMSLNSNFGAASQSPSSGDAGSEPYMFTVTVPASSTTVVTANYEASVGANRAASLQGAVLQGRGIYIEVDCA